MPTDPADRFHGTDDDFDPPADHDVQAHTTCTSTFRVPGDIPCDVHRDGVHRCDPQIDVHGAGHECECGQEWTPDEAAMASNAGLDALVGRFNALSDTDGNPGATAPPPGACICGPRGDGTGPYDGDPDPDCPEHGAVYATPIKVHGRGQRIPAGNVSSRLQAILDAATTPGGGIQPTRLLDLDPVGLFAAVRDALAALRAGPGEPLAHALNHLAATLTDIQARIAEDHGAILARLPLNPQAAAERVTRHHAQGIIAGVLRAHPRYIGGAIDELAQALAEALYGPEIHPDFMANRLRRKGWYVSSPEDHDPDFLDGGDVWAICRTLEEAGGWEEIDGDGDNLSLIVDHIRKLGRRLRDAEGAPTEGDALVCPQCGNDRGTEGQAKGITCSRCGTLTPPVPEGDG